MLLIKNKPCSVIARSYATKQSRTKGSPAARKGGKMDCFALLAMTGIKFVLSIKFQRCAEYVARNDGMKTNKKSGLIIFMSPRNRFHRKQTVMGVSRTPALCSRQVFWLSDHRLFFAFPFPKGNSGWLLALKKNSPITAAEPWRIYTAFPFKSVLQTPI